MKPLSLPVKLIRIAAFAAYVLWELVLSNLRVAREVLRLKPRITPGVIAVPIDVRSEPEIFILANVITLTPGTITIGVSDDKKYLYVHSMFIEDPDEFRRGIKDGFERKIQEIFR